MCFEPILVCNADGQSDRERQTGVFVDFIFLDNIVIYSESGLESVALLKKRKKKTRDGVQGGRVKMLRF